MRKPRLKSYHLVWLSCHPERSAVWLQERLADGFHIHHADGDHSNDSPNNLLMIEGLDHMLIVHGHKVASIFTRENCIKRAKKRWENVSPEKRSKLMRRVANARWRAQRLANQAARRAGIECPATPVEG